MNLIEILSPLNNTRAVRLYSKYFKSPLHYIYYFIYAKDDKQRESVLSAPTVEDLLALNYQLQHFAVDVNNINKYVYTLITYLYCRYKDYRDAINDMDINMPLKYMIINDNYIGTTKNKYAVAIKEFKNALLSH